MLELLLSAENWPPLLLVYGFAAFAIGFSMLRQSKAWKKILIGHIAVLGILYIGCSLMYQREAESEQLVPMLLFLSFLMIYSFVLVINAFLSTK